MDVSATDAAQTTPGPLAGVRVLDLTDRMAAYGPKLLAGLGAEVVLVEPPGGIQRRRRPPHVASLPGGERAAGLYFLHYDAGKRSVTLDLAAQAGRDLLRRLLDCVDIVFDNGALARLGFDPEALARKTPPLVVVSVTPFGLRSARSDWHGGDLICQAMSGMIGLFGWRDERPARFGPEQAYEMGGLAAALGALIALYRARGVGEGEVIDIAIERVCALVTLQMSNASVYHQFGVNRARSPRGEGVRGVLYETRDGYVMLGAYRRPRELVQMLADAGAAEDLPELRARLSEAEFAADAHVEDVVRRFAARCTRAELVDAAQAHAMLALPVNDAADLIADPFLKGRAFFVQVPHPELEAAFADAGPPMRLGRTPYRIAGRPPLLGEHTDSVLARIGLDAAAVARLRARGVV
jgi:benzylsuccinate CoA-transferase BbsE subunit